MEKQPINQRTGRKRTSLFHAGNFVGDYEEPRPNVVACRGHSERTVLQCLPRFLPTRAVKRCRLSVQFAKFQYSTLTTLGI